MKKVILLVLSLVFILYSCQKESAVINDNIPESKKYQEMRVNQSDGIVTEKNGICILWVRFGRPKHNCTKKGICEAGWGCGPIMNNNGEPLDKISFLFEDEESAITSDLIIDDDTELSNGDDTEEHYYIKSGTYSYNEEINGFVFDVYFQ